MKERLQKSFNGLQFEDIQALFGNENSNITIEQQKLLSEAKKLQNKGIKNAEIREKTGWFVGLDGNWKFIIDDTNADFIVSEEWMRKKATGNVPDFNYSFPFEKIFKHNEFTKKYPNLAPLIKFNFYDNPSKTDGGKIQIDNKGNQVIAINIGFKGDINESIRKIALHEIQHGIQKNESVSINNKLVDIGGTSSQLIFSKLKSSQKGGRGIVVYNRKNKKIDFSGFNDNHLKDIANLLYENNYEEIEARAVMQNNDLAKVVSELEEGFYYVADMIPNQNTVLRLKDTKDLNFFQTSAGDIYGFLDKATGEIYIDPNRMIANTPIHELGHVWVNLLKEKNKNLYNRGIALIKGSKY